MVLILFGGELDMEEVDEVIDLFFLVLFIIFIKFLVIVQLEVFNGGGGN